MPEAVHGRGRVQLHFNYILGEELLLGGTAAPLNAGCVWKMGRVC